MMATIMQGPRRPATRQGAPPRLRDRGPAHRLHHRVGRAARRARRLEHGARAESFGLVGESGSGKSTLALGAIGYLAANGRVTDGSVRLNGVDLVGLPAKQLRELWGSRIGLVYQSPLSALNPVLTIGQQLAEVAHLHLGMDAGAARLASSRCSTEVDMPDPEAVDRSATRTSSPAACCSAASSPWR